MLPNIKTCENWYSNLSENLIVDRVDKIARVNSIRITKSFKFTLILYGVEVRSDVDIIILNAPAQSIYREVYECI